MFKPSKANNVKDYIASAPKDRKDLVEFLHDFIQQSAPTLKPHFANNMLGYGSFPYKSSKKEMLTWPVVALANQKNYISIYVCSIQNGKYVAETYAKELGKVSVGKSCIRFKKLEDVHLPTLKKVLKIAAKKPGLAM